jgi:hypothetical protein
MDNSIFTLTLVCIPSNILVRRSCSNYYVIYIIFTTHDHTNTDYVKRSEVVWGVLCEFTYYCCFREFQGFLETLKKKAFKKKAFKI